MTGTTINNDALKFLPTWTAICTFIGFPIGVQSQQRCATAVNWWPCFGSYSLRLVGQRANADSLRVDWLPNGVVATAPGRKRGRVPLFAQRIIRFPSFPNKHEAPNVELTGGSEAG